MVVVGGGVVGTAFAHFAAAAGFAVTLVDRESPATLSAAPFDGRAFAIAYGTRRILETAGLWDEVAAAAQAIEQIRVSEAGSPFFLHYHHAELGPDPLGWMVEARHLRHGLYRARAARAGVTLLAPLAVEAVVRDAAAATVRLSDGRSLHTPLVIAADGGDSPLRRDAAIAVTQWDYGQIAIVATVEHERPHHGIAHEHFRPDGPFAILPLPERRSSLVWTEPEARAYQLLALSRADLDRHLRVRFGDFLGAVGIVGPIWSYPLRLRLADRYAAPRLALIGDAAHTLHPLAGQNLNLGFRDAAALVEVLADARRLGLDIGAADVLARYERWRRVDNLTLFAVTDGFNRLFSNHSSALRLVRGLGMAGVDRVAPLKRLFMAHARGTVGKLPRLVQGRQP